MSATLSVVDERTRATVVLINVGTPDAPTTSAVRRYLREFLSDPRVIDLPALGRWALLNLVILPFRPRKSAALYRAIWTPQGSPLLVHGRALAAALQARLPQARVALGMRYGSPALAEALADAGDRVVLVPLFPQYASATAGSALAEARRLIDGGARRRSVTEVPPFFDDDGFLAAAASKIMEATQAGVDAVLLSYHGVPVSQVQATVAPGHVCGGDPAWRCCAALSPDNARCYRAQCLATSRALEARLRAAGCTAPVSTSFQSRLGRARWIGPATVDAVDELARSGKKRLAVACPSFVADCLETLEEIGVQLRARFLAAGGERFTLVPCLNDDARFVDALARMVARALGPPAEATGTATGSRSPA
ncbi:MAG: ferrochelatase [Deltaproteobacteria bacterium RBG_16_71_12]|nr:MAG: ferrochelatase [Deltaproteobacteria bacterium RBG_16_71_12]